MCSRPRALLLVLTVWPVDAAAQLTLTRTEHAIVVTSSAPPTWRLVLAVNPQASMAGPGGGTVRALHIPADSRESIVSTDPRAFCCGGWGLDNLEWRYIDGGKGVRAPLGTTARITSLRITRQTPVEIDIQIAGQWKNIPRFTRTIEIRPQGYRTRIEADWDGPGDKRGMWWLISLFRANWMENGRVTIAGGDSPAVALPIAKGNVFPLPTGIEFPYTVVFPLKQGPLPALSLRVHVFGTTGPEAKNYELWPGEKGMVMFYPRWVKRPLEKRRYVFDYEWQFATEAGGAGSAGISNE
jgi:hypothetical protein